MLPQEMGCGSGMACRRRLRDWQEAGVWDSLQMLEEVADAMPPIRQSWGRPRQRPAKLHADKA